MDSAAHSVTGYLMQQDLGTSCHASVDRTLANKVNNLFCTCSAMPQLQVDHIIMLYLPVLYVLIAYLWPAIVLNHQAHLGPAVNLR